MIFKDMPAREFIAWCKARVGGSGLAECIARAGYSAREWWGVTDRGDWMLWVMTQASVSILDQAACIQGAGQVEYGVKEARRIAKALGVEPEPDEIESAARLRVANWLRRSVKLRWIESVGRP